MLCSTPGVLTHNSGSTVSTPIGPEQERLRPQLCFLCQWADRASRAYGSSCVPRCTAGLLRIGTTRLVVSRCLGRQLLHAKGQCDVSLQAAIPSAAMAALQLLANAAERLGVRNHSQLTTAAL